MKKKLAAFLILFLLPLPTAQAGIVLDGTTESLEVVTSTTATIDYSCSFTDNTTTTFTPDSSAGQITTATTTTFVAAPAASTQRDVIECSFHNLSSTTQNVLTIQRDVSGTNRTFSDYTLDPGEALEYSMQTGWIIKAKNGLQKTRASELGLNSRTIQLTKSGTGGESAGQRYYWAKDAGIPAAWNPGSPGLNGANVTCNTTTDAGTAGSPMIADPTAGALYLVSGTAATTVASQLIEIVDLLWYNTGLVVTTTTAQSITTPTWPARDTAGTTNGQDIQIGIYVTTATTNVGAITNTTMSYTDQDGNSGATGTIPSFPATAVAGTLVPFAYATGDSGVRSVQSVTLGTSYGGGAISLVAYRMVGMVPTATANQGAPLLGAPVSPAAPGVRLYNGSCLWFGQYLASATATNVQGMFSIAEK